MALNTIQVSTEDINTTSVINTTGKDLFLGNKVVPIEDSYDKDEKYRVVVERYYTIRYVLQLGVVLGDYTVFFHSNRICVVALAPTHFLRATRQTITKVNFQVSGNVNYLRSHALGKSKRGALMVTAPNNFLMHIDCADGSTIGICACIPGRVLEINKALAEDPNLMTRDSWGKGYLAIILPSISDFERYRNSMLKPEDVSAAKKFWTDYQ